MEERGARRDGGRDREAVLVHWLLMNPKQWVHRRVERFELVDDRTVRRHMSVDFELPTQVSELGDVSVADLGVVPLTVLYKQRLRAFDLRAADGEALPILGSDESTEIACRAIVELAESVLGEPPADETAKMLRGIVQISDGAYVEWPLGYLRRAAEIGGHASDSQLKDKGVPDATIDAWRELSRLMGDRVFDAAIEEFARGFILMTPNDAEGAPRRIVKIAYEAPIPWVSTERFRTRMGWKGADVVFDVPAASRARSYHVELLAPQDAEIITAKFAAGGQADSEDLCQARTHLQLSDVDPGSTNSFRARLRAVRAGFLRQAVATCVLALALIVYGLVRMDGFTQEIETAATLLLLVPGALAAYAIRPGEHALVSSVLLGVRVAIAVSALCAITAGATLLGGFCVSTLRIVWGALAAVAAACTLAVSCSYWLPRPPDPR